MAARAPRSLPNKKIRVCEELDLARHATEFAQLRPADSGGLLAYLKQVFGAWRYKRVSRQPTSVSNYPSHSSKVSSPKWLDVLCCVFAKLPAALAPYCRYTSWQQ